MDLKEQILVALGLNKEEVNLAWQEKTDDGTILSSTADELAEGVDISVLTEDGTTILLPIGTYVLASGVKVVVEEEGVVASLEEAEVEEVPEEEVEEELAEEADVADWEGMEKRIKNLEDAIADLKGEEEETKEEVEEVEEMSEEVLEPSETPRTVTTKTTEVVEFSSDDFAKLKEENEKLKTELAEQPASAPLEINKFSSEKQVMSKKDYMKLSRRERFLHDLNK